MKSICKPVVAGQFYPADPEKLKRQINNYLENVQLSLSGMTDILGVISPHAGYMFSGQCAAYSFQALRKKDFDLAVVIAPSHQFEDFHFSVGDYDTFETPLGEVEVDRELTKKLQEDSKFVFYPHAHTREHSLEVQLPFLQVINPQAKILPIQIGRQYDQSSIYLSKKLTELLKERMDRTVFIVSSDLSHYHDHSTAEKMDKSLAESIENLNIDSFYKGLSEGKFEACGYGGIMTLMNLALLLDYPKVKNLKYTHSGESSGDYDHVVGYLSTIFYR